MQPRDLLATAKVLLKASSKKPSQANLRRAVSTAYYAVFHHLARTSADLLIGGKKSGSTNRAWRQVYRALDHKPAANACIDGTLTLFPKGIQDFADAFTTLQKKRHNADYDPFVIFTKSGVQQDIATAGAAMAAFDAESARDRRAFCAFVLFKKRP